MSTILHSVRQWSGYLCECSPDATEPTLNTQAPESTTYLLTSSYVFPSLINETTAHAPVRHQWEALMLICLCALSDCECESSKFSILNPRMCFQVDSRCEGRGEWKFSHYSVDMILSAVLGMAERLWYSFFTKRTPCPTNLGITTGIKRITRLSNLSSPVTNNLLLFFQQFPKRKFCWGPTGLRLMCLHVDAAITSFVIVLRFPYFVRFVR